MSIYGYKLYFFNNFLTLNWYKRNMFVYWLLLVFYRLFEVKSINYFIKLQRQCLRCYIVYLEMCGWTFLLQNCSIRLPTLKSLTALEKCKLNGDFNHFLCYSESRMTTNIPNVTPMLPEADFPGEKPDKPEVIRSGVGKCFLYCFFVFLYLSCTCFLNYSILKPRVHV